MSEIEVKLKRLHPAQQEIIDTARRFNVLKCGRRFGKTELTKELAIQPALDNFPVGYWTPTYKDLHDVWIEMKYTLADVIKQKDEQVKQITLITGGKIDFWSMDDPNSGRGRKYKRAIIDEAEKARHFKEAWELTIRATLADYRGDAWFMSTPKFGQTYFKEIAKNKDKPGFEDWQSWVKTTYDNPHISHDEIEHVRLQLDNLSFRCEYLAEDVDVVGKPFAYAFNKEKHVGVTKYNQLHPLYLSFDFNVDPITCVAFQHYDNWIYAVKEFRLSNSDIYQLCDQIKAYFPFAVYFVTGDATGQNRSAITAGNLNYYTIIKQKLSLNPPQLKVPGVNPAVSDTRVLMNSILQNANFVIDKENCPYFIKDLQYVEVDNEGDIIKDRQSEFREADLLDCGRYYLNTFHKTFLKLSVDKFIQV